MTDWEHGKPGSGGGGHWTRGGFERATGRRNLPGVYTGTYGPLDRFSPLVGEMYTVAGSSPFESVTEHQLDDVVERRGILGHQVDRYPELVSGFSGRRCGESRLASFEAQEKFELLNETPDGRSDEELDPKPDGFLNRLTQREACDRLEIQYRSSHVYNVHLPLRIT